MLRWIPIAIILLSTELVIAQKPVKLRSIDIDTAWAGNSVNTTIFRKNSIISFGNTQVASFYNSAGYVVLAKRKLGSSNWELKQTSLRGNIRDAHNGISIMIDGAGYLHIAWDHHNNQLHYAVSKAPLSLEMNNPVSMTGKFESSVSYPEFYRLKNGNLLFLYRDGGSGRGNLVINQYHLKSKSWSQLHSNLIDGEGKRNAYWQACIDQSGTIHLAWVWRETPDVASNHDMCYAKSIDGGKTWINSNNKKYALPINNTTAEYAWRIAPKSELINQTSIGADNKGNPFIATYWRDSGSNVPQYHVIYKQQQRWQAESLSFRKSSFTLSGMGTKQIPISRPQVIVNNGAGTEIIFVFRDEERNNKVSIAKRNLASKNKQWQLIDLTDYSVGSWEPSFDNILWNEKKQLHLFVQPVIQADAEGVVNTAATMARVIEWNY